MSLSKAAEARAAPSSTLSAEHAVSKYRMQVLSELRIYIWVFLYTTVSNVKEEQGKAGRL